MMSGRRRAVASATLALVIGVAVFAFAASNTVPATSAGVGSGVISGYTVTNVVYTPNATTPTDLDQVAFTIAPTGASTVKIKLTNAGPWYACVNTAGSVVCDTTSPQATIQPADNLTVVAVQ